MHETKFLAESTSLNCSVVGPAVNCSLPSTSIIHNVDTTRYVATFGCPIQVENP